MPALIVYLLKVNVALCLFYIAYRFALRPLTFYYLNRFFLVFGIIFATVYPLVNVSSFFEKHEVIRRQLTTIVPNWHAVLPAVQHQAATINYWGIPIALFWIGVILMTMRLAAQFISLYRIHRQSEQSHYFGHSFRNVKTDVNPFSFWQEIYLNPGKHTDTELRSIIQHEQVHVKQWHTLDVILAELSVVFYWFNPGVWFMKQAVKENLEFITDREILRSGVDEKVYQYSLVRVSALKPGAAIVNNFNFLTIKKRIMMMNKKRSSRANLTRYVVLPLIMLLALIFTVSKADVATKKISVLVKKILPVGITAKQTPFIKPAHVKIVMDTVKPKIVRDTDVTLTFIKSDNNEKVDTLIDPKDKKGQKSIKFVRVNGYNITGDNKTRVVIVNDKGDVENKNLSEVVPDQIEQMNVVDGRDSTTTVYGYKVGKGKAVVVKLRPVVKVTTLSLGVSNSTATPALNTTLASVGGLAPRAYTISDRDDDDKVVYIIDPKNINTSEIEKTRKLFKDNGFDLKVREDYSGKVLTRLYVQINHEGKGSSSSASSSYSNDDMSKTDYIIKVVGDKTTGQVAIEAEK